VAPIGGGANRFYLNGDPDNYGNLLVNINGEGLSATQSLMKLAANAGSNAASTLLYGSLSGSTVFKFEASGKLSLLDVNGSYYTAMEVRDDQAIWYDGDQFSWGFGGTWNRFARPITIGGNSPTPVGTALLITGGNDIRMEGGGARRIRFHQGLIEEGYVGYADNILTIQNNTGEYIMLRSNGHDQLFIGEDASLFGDLNMTGGINGISDRRTKQDIKPISNALETILALNGKTYQFKREEFPALDLPTGNQYGLIAQEVEEILPDLVSTHTPVEIDGEAVNLKGIEYQALIPVLIEAIKEQNKIIEAMKGQIKQLEQSMVSQN
ncbi:MAG: tail fiber domain-containing protein, partial [Saprospiraceae bacterium]|nr:tail fiber domain-containing protein [Saprospiraceae bacterium]